MNDKKIDEVVIGYIILQQTTYFDIHGKVDCITHYENNEKTLE